MSGTTSFPPDLSNKTTAVADDLSRIIHLITLLFVVETWRAAPLSKLGNEVVIY